jgi:hypothetical protein
LNIPLQITEIIVVEEAGKKLRQARGGEKALALSCEGISNQ